MERRHQCSGFLLLEVEAVVRHTAPYENRMPKQYVGSIARHHFSSCTSICRSGF
jgi:hypothetical protein